MADSSTDGDALDHVAVAGDDLPGLDDHESPTRSPVAGTDSSVGAAGPSRRRAIVSRLARRSVSAWALPRPSATASARLANTTVTHSQTTMVQFDEPTGRSTNWTVVSTRADLDHEHDRVLDLDPRVQLLERVGRRLPENLGVEQPAADPVRLG